MRRLSDAAHERAGRHGDGLLGDGVITARQHAPPSTIKFQKCLK